MSIIAKYKFDSSIYANLIPEFNAEFTDYTVTDEVDSENSNHIIRTIECDTLPTLMRFGTMTESGASNGANSLLELLYADAQNLTDMTGFIRLCGNLTQANIVNVTSNVNNMYTMCQHCHYLTQLDVSTWDVSNVTDMRYMFGNCQLITSLDVSNWDTSKVTDMSSMFQYCYNLTSLDVSNFNTSKVTNMFSMFDGCNKLTSLDLSNFDTSKVTNMYAMFYGCNNLTTLDVSNFDTSNVTSMGVMFTYCNNLTSLDVSNFNTSKVNSMQSMFYNCTNLTSLDVSNFNTSNVTSMSNMFFDCKSLTLLDVSKWDTSKVTNMAYMFYDCTKLTTLDISNFNTSKVTDASDMFTNIPLLTDIGMIYCDQSTIDKVTSLLPTDTTQTIWVEDVDIKDLTPVNGVVFKQYAKNTEVMLTSPLLEGDEIVVKDGKTYHYHKMGMVVLDGSENYEWQVFGGDDITHNRGTTIGFHKTGSKGSRLPNQKQYLSPSQLFSNRFKVGNYNQSYADKRCITADNTFNLCFDWNELPERTSDGVNQWLQQNPTTVVYELETPYYELISEGSLDISLIAESSDITNSSNIPLNMTINNRGLSTVAMSPSTTYTVAFDKDTDGEVVVNLCGNEVTTTDNIVEITTPSEIDNELIFYGDGVEVSNVRLLEGSVSGDSIPRESFKGLKSSFEDGYIPSPIFTNIEGGIVNSATQIVQSATEIRNGKIYTLHMEVTENTLNSLLVWELTSTYGQSRLNVLSGETGMFTGVVEVPGSTVSNTIWQSAGVGNGTSVATKEGSATVKNLIILEGDWTHLTEEDWNNLGKYKVEYKVTGKNKYPTDSIDNPDLLWKDSGGGTAPILYSSDEQAFYTEGHRQRCFFNLKPNTPYTVSVDIKSDERGSNYYDFLFKNHAENISYPEGLTTEWTRHFITRTTDETGYLNWVAYRYCYWKNIQLEEGTTATSYEPYKEYTKTFYLNSPLLEGDTIEEINGVATHVKRYGKENLNSPYYQWFLDTNTSNLPQDGVVRFYRSLSNKKYTNSNDTTLLCDRLSPLPQTTYNFKNGSNCIISDGWNATIYVQIKESLLTTVDLNGFKQWLQANPTTVIYELASPIYEPISTESILCDSYVNGHLDFDSNVPIEKVQFKRTEMESRYLNINTNYTIQFESDNIGILENVYFGVDIAKGLNMPIIKGTNTFEIMSGTGVGFPYLSFNGIGFNASNIQVVATDRDVNFGYFKGLQSSFESETDTTIKILTKDIPITLNSTSTGSQKRWDKRSVNGGVKVCTVFTTNPYPLDLLYRTEGVVDYQGRMLTSEGICTFTAPEGMEFYGIQLTHEYTDIPVNFHAVVVEGDYSHLTLEEFSHLEQYKVECKVVGKNKIDMNKVLDVNSWTVSDAYYYIKLQLKPNTEYVVSKNKIPSEEGVYPAICISQCHRYESITNIINGGWILHRTTPQAKRLSFRFITPISGVVYLCTSQPDSLKEFISNLGLTFQLEEGTQATSYEPYKEYTKTIYLNSPLLKGDTIEVHNGKLCHYHKMGMVVLDGSEDWVMRSNSEGCCRAYLVRSDLKLSPKIICDSINSYTVLGLTSTQEGISGHGTVNEFRLYLLNTRLTTPDVAGVKQWLSENPTTVVYELAEPWYEEIEPTQEDLIIASVKEGDLHIDTIVPISSKVTYNVNVQLLTDFEQSIVEQVQATQTTDLQSILDEEIDN